MKKAVISSGGKQYMVTEGDQLNVGMLKTDSKQLKFEPLLVIDGNNISIGTPTAQGKLVTAELLQPQVKGEKVLAIRYKSKKRVHKIRGHRQDYSSIFIKSIN